MPVSIHETTEKITIQVSSKIKIWSVLSLSALLVVWYFIEQLFFGIAANSLFITSNQLLAYLWLSFWTAAGLLTFFQLLWHIFGKEHLISDKYGSMTIEKQLLFFRNRVNIKAKHIQINTQQIRRFPMSLKLGTLEIIANEDEYRFGEKLTPTESEQIKTALSNYLTNAQN